MVTTADIDAGYENIGAVCARCGTRNVYNRATDIGHFNPIANQRIACENPACKANFDIVGDLINPAHEMLLLDASAFLREKRYIQAVLSATTAYELFFSHYLRVEFVYRASTRDTTSTTDRLEWMNAATQRLESATARHTFEAMRKVFLRATADDVHPATMSVADAYVQALPNQPQKVPRADVEAVGDQSLRRLLLRVHDSTIAKLRNDVVHKRAYRPRLEETKTAVDDAYDTIFALGQHYKLAGDNYHLNESPDDP